MGINTLTSKNAQARKLRILDTLRAAPNGLTCPQLAEKVHLSRKQAGIYLRIMEKDNQLHVLRWDTDCGTNAAYWIAGPGVSAPQPARMTPSELGLRYRAKLRTDPDAFEQYTIKNRVRQRIKTMRTWKRKKLPQHYIVPVRPAA